MSKQKQNPEGNPLPPEHLLASLPFWLPVIQPKNKKKCCKKYKKGNRCKKCPKA
jgi:hypothetical protein